jgi:tetratricopeptide (TPR) repeat protein
MPSAATDPRPVRPILLVVGPSKRRILILRVVRETTAIAVCASDATTPTLHFLVEQRMTRSSSTTAYWLAVCLAAAFGGGSHGLAAEPASTTSIPVHGAMVDADTPATYRLPVIGIFDPPKERFAMRSDEVRPKSSYPPIANEASPPTTAVQAPAALAYPTTKSELTNQLLPAVQRGYNLAQHGAFFAARTEFIQVLRRVAQAKDAGSSSDEHARALAAGLRALDEGGDFVPQGVQLEAELDVRKVASSHRTPVLRDYPEEVMPQEAVVLYHSYAQQELAISAGGEQAGSMALYGLGKVYARLAERSDDDVQYTRSALTMYSAALDACPDNHMAANEMGVILCRTGHAAEAVDRFTRAIDLAPNATAYHNLAVAQQKLGMPGQAAANEQESQRLAALDRSTGEVSRRAGVQWVSPAEMARVSQPVAPGTATQNTESAARPTTTGQSKWR